MRTVILGDNIGLRRYRPGDAPLLYEAARASQADLFQWLPWCHADYSLGDSETFVELAAKAWDEKQQFSFIVFARHGGAFLGGLGLNFINGIHRFANLGYWTRSGCTGRGIASEATRMGARFGLDELGLHRIEIVAAVDNVASQKVALKAGAIREGVLRNRLCLHGKPVDAVMFSIV